MARGKTALLKRLLVIFPITFLATMIFMAKKTPGFQGQESPYTLALPIIVKQPVPAAVTPSPTQPQDPSASSTPPPPSGGATPVTMAFTADSEALTLWPQVLQLIVAEGAELISVQGDYWGQTKTYVDWLDSLKSQLGTHQVSPYVSDPLLLGPATGAEIGPPNGPYADQLAHDFYHTVTFMEDELGATWGGCIGNGDKYGTVYPDSYFRVPYTECKVTYNGPDKPTSGRAGDYWVKYKEITLVFQNHQGDAKWPVDAFAAAGQVPGDNLWRLCLWHGNHLDFNGFSKGHAYDNDPFPDSSLPYELYQACAEAGALVINGNTHQYTRTCVLDNIGDWQNGGPNNLENERNRIERDPSRTVENHTTTSANCPNAGKPNSEANGVEEVTIGPGRTMVIVSSLGGGFEMRDYIGNVYAEHQSKYLQDRWRHDGDGWWSTIIAGDRYCRNNCTKGDLSGQDRANDLPMPAFTDVHGAGALFITFNYGGDPRKAHGYYKTIEGQILDEFIITYQPR